MFLNPWYGSQAGCEGTKGQESPRTQPSLGTLQRSLDALQSALSPGWTVHLLRDGRFFYCNHASQTSSWLPPLDNWDSSNSSLPYGWESAVDKDSKVYFINHLNKTTSYEDPRKELQEEPALPRDVDLVRDPDMGFGFVAGSEKPVIIRFVTDGGPSVDKLLPGDQILAINGQDVKKAPRDQVIQLVRSCKDKVSLTVCQPPVDNSSRKSALLSAAKKQKLKNNPAKVRFAESVDINGCLSMTPSYLSSSESTSPFMPNVLKVFLENGQTKSFKYDSSTTVSDVLESLHQKLGIKCRENFSLVVEHVKSVKRNKLTLLDPKETLSRIAARPGAQMLRCLYRISFVPRDSYELLRKDSVAFEYLYLQCCNDVIQERFAPELKYDIALRLAALHIHQHALSAGATTKLSIKSIERDFGLDRFVPASLTGTMKRKELRKLLSHFLKLHGTFTTPGQKQLTPLQAKLHYLKIISELPSYGAKCFSTYASDGSNDLVILVSPRFGVSQITGLRNSSVPESLCEIEQIVSVEVIQENDLTRKVKIFLKHPDKENLVLSLEDRDAEELVLLLQGYHQLLAEKPLEVIQSNDNPSSNNAPPYHSRHTVANAPWSYIQLNNENYPTPRSVDFSMSPPYQQPPEGYQIPNGHIGKVENGDSSQLDSNMNKTASIYDNDGSSFKIPGLSSTPEEKDAPPSQRTSQSSYPEARNEEVIKRVAEMQQMVEDAEHYLSDADGETTDVESVKSGSYGKLKHSDSLLLLTQGQKLITNGIDVETEEQSGSDTDSQSTPGSSPAHKPEMKPSGSSFGLHSPDNLPINLERQQDDIKTIIKQLEDNTDLPYQFAEGTLYLDPDIIDLTMIPPPITPDDDYAKNFPPQLNTPPTPFADREVLDKELKALERDVGDVKSSIRNHNPWDRNAHVNDSGTGASDTEDTNSMSSNNSSLARPNSENKTGLRFSLATLRQLGFNLGEGEDIDAFIANLSIPPPPEGLNELQAYVPPKPLGNDYDISAFIIPPPPSSSANNNRSSDIIRRLYEAKAGIIKVVGDQDNYVERDNDIDEVKVSSQQVRKNSLPSGRVASLQKHFEVSAPGNYHSLKINKNKITTYKETSFDDIKSQNGRPEMDTMLAKALDENNEMFKKLDNDNRSPKRPGTLKTFDYSMGSSEDLGPPPPPRTPITRHDPFFPSYQKGFPKNDTKSTDSLNECLSPVSKRSSSNDSLASVSSVSTVKSVSKSDLPPELPPRPSPKNNLRPPMRSSSQESPSIIRSPSPVRKLQRSPTPTEKPPAIPSRLKKPSLPGDSHSHTLKLKSSHKPAAPQPPTKSATLHRSRSPSEKPQLPAKTSHNSIKNSFHAKPINGIHPKDQNAPLLTSSPKLPVKHKLVNGKGLHDGDDSIDSGSFDQDSLEESDEIDAMPPASREAYKFTASIVSDSWKQLGDLVKRCTKMQNDGNINENETEFLRVKEILTSESRQFVTASKLFVKSATETEPVLLQSLTNCVTILRSMVKLCHEMVNTTNTPQHTLTVVSKVKEVTGIYLLTVRAALSAAGRGMDHPSMNTLMAQATNLAGVLTSLMRTLKVFSP